MMSLSALAQVMHASLIGADAHFTGVSTDTRMLALNDLFIALTGPRFDGHRFLSEAHARGAVGALVAQQVETKLPYIYVSDTRLALGKFAAHWRGQFNFPVIGVTGSNGKTTVKEMIAAILSNCGPVCATRGNLNNDIGVPLTLLRLRTSDHYAVIEMGMNHLGEIGYLSGLAQPTVALITNAQAAHLEGVGTIADVARAKGEIFSGLATNGIAVINADDTYSSFWRGLAASRQCLTFGLVRQADISAVCRTDVIGSTMQWHTRYGDIDIRLPLLGRHNATNALAAGAAALAAGATLHQVKIGLEGLKAIPGRLEIKLGINGAHVIDDTYNANPGSLTAGLEILKETPGERILVLGDMAELGPAAADFHRQAGESARQLGIDKIFAIGELAALAAQDFGQGGSIFADAESLIDALRPSLHANMTLLIKGSRIMRMERIVTGVTLVSHKSTITAASHEAT